ncbi:MAG: M28 family peptidase, partial [Abditibacteriales bacterium]|nr:M28 family peptidase [Abditibacteriales bacterium]MDW8367386.1 M28 family peptidase [Abditibacteriales bacterium]
WKVLEAAAEEKVKQASAQQRTNQPPTVEFISPPDGATVQGILGLTLRATDDKSLKLLEVQVGSLRPIRQRFKQTKRVSVHLTIDTNLLLDGPQTIRATARDRLGHSDTKHITLVVQNAPPHVTFDANRAFADLQKQVDFGPRVPNTAGHRQTRDFLVAELGKYADSVTRQDFTQTLRGTTYQMSNIIGVINPSGQKKLMLCAHWDTRPLADEDPDPANHTKPIPGANDGASGVAVLLEVARVLKAKKPKVQVIITFFDGEDFALEPGDFSHMLLGSKYFAQNMGKFRPDEAILIDMIGDSNLGVNRDRNSVLAAPALYQRVLTAARALGYANFFDRGEKTVIDDHIPLIQAGVKAIDLIDFDYPDETNRYWHTLQDTPDKCSPQSLKIIGETLLKVIEDMSP